MAVISCSTHLTVKKHQAEIHDMPLCPASFLILWQVEVFLEVFRMSGPPVPVRTPWRLQGRHQVRTTSLASPVVSLRGISGLEQGSVASATARHESSGRGLGGCQQ